MEQSPYMVTPPNRLMASNPNTQENPNGLVSNTFTSISSISPPSVFICTRATPRHFHFFPVMVSISISFRSHFPHQSLCTNVFVQPQSTIALHMRSLIITVVHCNASTCATANRLALRSIRWPRFPVRYSADTHLPGGPAFHTCSM